MFLLELTHNLYEVPADKGTTNQRTCMQTFPFILLKRKNYVYLSFILDVHISIISF